MSIWPTSNPSKPPKTSEFIPSAALNNPLRISTASKLDNLLNSELGQKMFSRPNSRERPTKKTEKKRIKTSSSFVEKNENSGTRLRNSSSLDSNFEKVHSEITKVNEQLKEAQQRFREDFEKLGLNLSPEKRKNILEGLKEVKKKCESLKESRLKIIKRQRIVKNEYQSTKGCEVYNWNEFKKKEKAGKIQDEKNKERFRRVSLIHFVDPALNLKPDMKKPEKGAGIKILNKTMPYHYHDSSVIFKTSSPVFNKARQKKLAEVSHGNRDFNIITGTYFK